MGMRQLLRCTTLLVLTVLANFAHADGREIRACDFDVKARCASGGARVTLADGKMMRVEVNVFWCALHGRPGYTCIIDSSRGGEESTWSDDAGATVITNGSPWNPAQPDRVKVTVGRDISIDLSEAQSLGRCGAGAELPRSITIPAQAKACRVQLGMPQE
jgi:hypothetical protein